MDPRANILTYSRAEVNISVELPRSTSLHCELYIHTYYTLNTHLIQTYILHTTKRTHTVCTYRYIQYLESHSLYIDYIL
jgi:hypothetical protein